MELRSKILRRNSYAEIPEAERQQDFETPRQRDRMNRRGVSSYKLPIKGRPLAASHAQLRIPLAHRRLERKVIGLDLKALKSNANSSFRAKDFSQRSTRGTSTTHKRAEWRQSSMPLTERRGELTADLMREFPCNTFLTSCNSLPTRRPPEMQTYTDRITTLMSSCEDQITELSHSHRHLALEKEQIQAKISQLKSYFEQPADFYESYIRTQVAEFHREKLAFIYGKNFQGRYLSSVSKAYL
jgi:hypothetical protein